VRDEAVQRLPAVEYRREEDDQGQESDCPPNSRQAERVSVGIARECECDCDAGRDQRNRKTREHGGTEQQPNESLREEERRVADRCARGQERENPRSRSRSIRELAPEGLREQSNGWQNGVDDADLGGIEARVFMKIETVVGEEYAEPAEAEEPDGAHR